MPECASCNTPYEADDRYCSQCGERLVESEFIGSGIRTHKSLSLLDVQYNLGLVYYKKGKYEEALEIWGKALEQDPENSEILARMAAAREQIQESS
jgi:tetratricopeptide (TPR) repeat protein